MSVLKTTNGTTVYPETIAENVKISEGKDVTIKDKVEVLEDNRTGKRFLGKACLWYHSAYEFGNTDDEAAQVIASNDLVFPGGICHYDNYNANQSADVERQIKILKKAKELNPNLKIFYYITIASWRRDGDYEHILGKGGVYDEEEASKHSGAVRINTKWELFQFLEYAAHAGGTKSGEKQFIETYTWTDDEGEEHSEDKYIDLFEGGIQLDGVFYDNAGWEDTEGRINQGFTSDLRDKYTQIVNFSHSKGLAACPNQVHADWYGETVSETNPNGSSSAITEQDFMLYESCHSQIGYKGRPLWRSYYGHTAIYNYYQNFYPKVKSKVICMDYLYGTGKPDPDSSHGEFTYEDQQKLATYCVLNAYACGAHYIDLNGWRSWKTPETLSSLFVNDGDDFKVVKQNNYTYYVYANGNKLTIYNRNSLQSTVFFERSKYGSTVFVDIYYNEQKIENIFINNNAHALDTDIKIEKLQNSLEDTTIEIENNTKYRLFIDDWKQELHYTDYVKQNNVIEYIKSASFFNTESSDPETGSIRFVRTGNNQLAFYIPMDTVHPGETVEFGFEIKEMTNGDYIGLFAKLNGDNVAGWTVCGRPNNVKSSYYPDFSNSFVLKYTVPDDAPIDSEFKINLIINGYTDFVYDIARMYLINVDELDGKIIKDFYTNLTPQLSSGYNYNSQSNDSCTLTTTKNTDMELMFTDESKYKAWSGFMWNLPNDTFQANHSYEVGCDSWVTNENNAGDIKLRFYDSAGERIALNSKTSTYSKANAKFMICGYINTSSNIDGTNCRMTLLCTSNSCKNSSEELYKATIKGLYIYDLDEENIVIRGRDISRTYIQLCRVTEENVEKDVTDNKLIANALYITDKGNLFITDHDGVKTDIIKHEESTPQNPVENTTKDDNSSQEDVQVKDSNTETSASDSE